ncbi:hypothetical protein NQ314_017701 [Rhamnusium bicolor]|uniref:C2H2-type domain-containing protein n=1 Tax=Rhamnusium bicolor TaxID=1586634 RepID=A0AAV8WSP6_9CUCU|nr:hypothetical protein NQ314_017701 [Rhamnusium bicolor]
MKVCNLMRLYSENCGASQPELLQGTKLRKHIATQATMLHLTDDDIIDLATFMAQDVTTITNHLSSGNDQQEQKQTTIALNSTCNTEKFINHQKSGISLRKRNSFYSSYKPSSESESHDSDDETVCPEKRQKVKWNKLDTLAPITRNQPGSGSHKCTECSKCFVSFGNLRFHVKQKHLVRYNQNRKLKTQGSNKIGGYCPAKMMVFTKDGKCLVKFCESHVGHGQERHLGHLFLTKTQRKNIAAKDLDNIEDSFNLKSSSVRHANDAISVEAWVNELKLSDSVPFYKPQDTL